MPYDCRFERSLGGPIGEVSEAGPATYIAIRGCKNATTMEITITPGRKVIVTSGPSASDSNVLVRAPANPSVDRVSSAAGKFDGHPARLGDTRHDLGDANLARLAGRYLDRKRLSRIRRSR